MAMIALKCPHIEVIQTFFCARRRDDDDEDVRERAGEKEMCGCRAKSSLRLS